MTMDLYGHLIDHNLWEAARKVGGTTGAHDGEEETEETPEPRRSRGRTCRNAWSRLSESNRRPIH
jgi:hypothetical protein